MKQSFDMLNPIVEIVLLLILFLANGVLAMAEMAVVSARKIRLQQRAEAGDENARTALQLARQPADFLSTVQVCLHFSFFVPRGA